MRGEHSITDLCRKEGIHPGIYYKWSKAFLEAGKQRLTGDTVREASSEEVNELRAENEELKEYLSRHDIKHIRTRTYHPMTQGKIERYHRSMKNLILLDNYYSPAELEARISEWVDYYNNWRYHEAINNVTPSDCFFGRDKEILEQRQRTKAETMNLRRKLYRHFMINDLMEDLG